MTEQDGTPHSERDGEKPSKFLKDCPVCQAKFSEKHIRILTNTPKRRLLHATCDVCHHALLFVQITTGGASGVMGIVTDLSVTDVRRLMSAPPISEDDVLRFHQALEHTDFISHIIRANRETKV